MFILWQGRLGGRPAHVQTGMSRCSKACAATASTAGYVSSPLSQAASAQRKVDAPSRLLRLPIFASRDTTLDDRASWGDPHFDSASEASTADPIRGSTDYRLVERPTLNGWIAQLLTPIFVNHTKRRPLRRFGRVTAPSVSQLAGQPFDWEGRWAALRVSCRT